MAADQTVKEWQSVSVSVPVKVTINDIIVLSDSDEEDVNIEVTSSERKEVESPDINIWHCSGVNGSGTRR
ncbi:zinc finger CCCH domain-containing protein, partial [Trifolium pratense]